jgi:hypothetical protein
MTTLIHKTWIMINGYVEYVVEGRRVIHVIGCTDMIENTLKGKWLGLNTIGMGVTKKYVRTGWCNKKNYYQRSNQ